MLIFATALVFSAVSHEDLLVGRLAHPYMTAVSLGLAGAYAVWIALFAGGLVWWRVSLGMAGLSVLLLSGSRGPLAATLVGAVAGFIIRRGRQAAVGMLLGSALLVGSVLVGERLGLQAVTRLDSTDTTGRDVVWYNTLTVIRAHPLAGVGSYRLGRYLGGPGEACPILNTAGNGTASAGCPAWIARLGSPWLIAHSLNLQQLAETGPLGLFGLFALLSVVVVATLAIRQPLASAVIFGMLVTTVTDNTLLVPSSFFAELFWVIAGTQLLQMRTPTVSAGWIAAAMLTLLSLPLLTATFSPPMSPLPTATPTRLSFFSAPADLRGSADTYTVYAKFDVPPGSYRASLNSCSGSPAVCFQLVTLPFRSGAQGSDLLTLPARLPLIPLQRLELRLLPGDSLFQLQPLATRAWSVRQQP
ncbi:O-antigen ligase family protein (plasmid) [Deinococcus radiomollis]|uniref:O-antigen ligase family protein n=1 Tax=Deinococcus radiomollis TaxID=468916 RepID=UPI0038916EE4